MANYLDTIIPLVIVFVFAAIFYSKFREPLSQFIGWLKEITGLGVEKIKEGAVSATDRTITYD